MVKLQEAENQIVIDYEVMIGGQTNSGLADPGDRNASNKVWTHPLPCGGRCGLLLRQE